MHWKSRTFVGLVLATSANVLAQNNQPNLPAYLSVVQSLASVLEPSTTTSSSFSSSTPSSSSRSSTSSSSSTGTSSTNSATNLATTASSPSPSTPSTAAPTSSVASAAANSTPSGIDPHTRAIILGVTIPVGLLLLAAIIICLLLCCRRRRRRARRAPSPESKFVNDKDWEHGNTSHHGYNSNSSLRTGHSNVITHNANHDSAPLMGAAHYTGPATSEQHRGLLASTHPTGATMSQHRPGPELYQHPAALGLADHPAYRNSNANPNVQNPFTPTPPITRKPVPNRGSTGSAISGISSAHSGHHNHTGLETGAVAGAGALAGAAAMHHHHNNNRHSDVSQIRPESWHRPLASHPHDASMYATAGAIHNYPQEQRRSVTPFSPDDVGSMHRSSQRFSQEPFEPASAIQQHQMQDGHGAIVAPTTAQRRSLQSRNSSNDEDRSTSRGPSRSPKRRSLSGGGEMWQADPVDQPALPTQSHHNSADMQYAAPLIAAARPIRSRHNSEETRYSSSMASPALPSNRHLGRAQKAHLYNSVDASNTDSSTSNESWESAQTEINPWDIQDTGRYPRFSGGSGASNAPLMPPSAAWHDGQERRWSGDMFNGDRGPRHSWNPSANRRNSGGMERRRLRFSEGEPEYYNEQGLVGRAL